MIFSTVPFATVMLVVCSALLVPAHPLLSSPCCQLYYHSTASEMKMCL